MPHFLTDQLHNQFLGGGLILMITGSIIALMKSTPMQLWRWFRRRVTVEVEILNSDPLFDYVTLWLHKQPYSSRSRRLTATSASRIREYDGDEDDVPAIFGEERKKRTLRLLLTPAPGRHVFQYGGNLIWLERNREKAGMPAGASAGRSGVNFSIKQEDYTITVLGRKQQVIRDLLEEIVVTGTPPSDTIRVFTSGFGYWKSRGVMAPRKMDSVVLPTGVAEGILEDARQFLRGAKWYQEIGIPWHRGYLFYGLPGTGKTSLIAALAGELQMNLYLLNIAGAGIDDEKLSSLMSDVRPGSIVLMEDVDCTVPNRQPEKESKGVTLSGLLNCLDGVQSTEGCMIFMTTNARERLDPALTRPGRVDVELEFGLATNDQILRLRDRIAPGYDTEAILEECAGKTMAEAQGVLLGKRGFFRTELSEIDRIVSQCVS
jgi:chaperone BCS1